MNTIAQVEDAVLQAVQNTLGDTLRRVESIGGGWTLDNLKRSLQFAPGAYVAFQGATRGVAVDLVDAKYMVYVVNKGTDDQNRRRGNARVIGAYDIIDRIAPVLANLTVDGVGTLRLAGINNLFRDAMFDLGGTVYAIQLELPNQAFCYEVDPTTLDDFITFDAVYDLAPDDPDNPTAEDTVTLPAASNPEDTQS